MAPRPGQKTVLITGCTPGGIGHALALEFHARGLHVIATARRTSVLTELAALGMTALELDVTREASIRACHDKVKELTGGKLDILINNAGRSHTIPATDINLDDVRQTFETNVFGLMAMCRDFADLLIEAKGLIINVASLGALTAYVFGSVYCASKGAVISYSRTLRAELRPFGVRVMVAMAGTVKSNIGSTDSVYSLPPDSIYQRVHDLFEARRTFSQRTATVKTDDFARQLVDNALAPERPSFVRRWFGRPDWFYAGGLSFIIWAGHSVGEWVVDAICYRLFNLPKLEAVLRQEAAQKKLK